MKTRFGKFTLNADTRQLLCDATEIHLSTKAFDLLHLLLARRPNVVSKEELFGHIWPNSHVVEANLNVVVSEVRRAIADNPQTPQFIRTVPRVGFAFCGSAAVESGVPTERADLARYWLVGSNRNFVLSVGENIIGRDPSCVVCVDNPDVSRRHALVQIDSTNGTAAIHDLQSTNGTFLGRARVRSQTPLADGDVIRVGPVELKFRDRIDEPQETRRIRRKSR
jgi:DNA-binding winged helix-turn-helix (wHTH) protein